MEIVVLAGGGGTRLWPLSDPARPKPFLPLLGDDTLIARTVGRVAPLGPSSVTVVTDRRYEALVQAQVPGVTILSEPMGRNTAPAIALAALASDGPVDEVMAVLPADHDVRDDALFRRVLSAAADHLATGAFGIEQPLVTLGIRPDRPATGYGYLRPRLGEGAQVAGLRAYPLDAFEEKPTPVRAEELLALPGVSWNAGIFLWRRGAILEALERDAPGVIDPLRRALERGVDLTPAYELVTPRSIDHAVMEPAAARGQVVMAAMDVGWSDVGSWTVLLGLLGSHGNGRVVQPGEHASLDRDDLAIVRTDGQLSLATGPRDILASTPVALLEGAAPDRPIVEALIGRVIAAEDAS